MFKTQTDIDNKKSIFELTYRAALSKDVRRGDTSVIYHQTLVNQLLDNVQIIPEEEDNVVTEEEFGQINDMLLQILKDKSQIEY